MEKKKVSTTQKKVAEVMHELKKGELHVGRSNTIVTTQKQALAIALSEAEQLKQSKQ